MRKILLSLLMVVALISCSEKSDWRDVPVDYKVKVSYTDGTTDTLTGHYVITTVDRWVWIDIIRNDKQGACLAINNGVIIIACSVKSFVIISLESTLHPPERDKTIAK